MFLLGMWVSVSGSMFLLGVSDQVGVSDQGWSLHPGVGSLSRVGVSVQGGFCPGGLCKKTPRIRKASVTHVIGMLSCVLYSLTLKSI